MSDWWPGGPKSNLLQAVIVSLVLQQRWRATDSREKSSD